MIPVLVVKPRFTHRDGMSFFAGYDQVSGPTLDVAGELYTLVIGDTYVEAELARARASQALEEVKFKTTSDPAEPTELKARAASVYNLVSRALAAQPPNNVVFELGQVLKALRFCREQYGAPVKKEIDNLSLLLGMRG